MNICVILQKMLHICNVIYYSTKTLLTKLVGDYDFVCEMILLLAFISFFIFFISYILLNYFIVLESTLEQLWLC